LLVPLARFHIKELKGVQYKKTRETRLMKTPVTVAVVVKGKAIPLQGWSGLEGSRMLRLPVFKTFGT